MLSIYLVAGEQSECFQERLKSIPLPTEDELYKRPGYITNDGRCGLRNFYDNLGRAGRRIVTINDADNGIPYSIDLSKIDIATDISYGTLRFLHESRRCMAHEFAERMQRTMPNPDDAVGMDMNEWERQELDIDWMSSEIIPVEQYVGEVHWCT